MCVWSLCTLVKGLIRTWLFSPCFFPRCERGVREMRRVVPSPYFEMGASAGMAVHHHVVSYCMCFPLPEREHHLYQHVRFIHQQSWCCSLQPACLRGSVKGLQVMLFFRTSPVR